MLSTYFKSALRSISRNRGYAFVNVIGLSLGITFALMAGLIIRSAAFYSQEAKVHFLLNVFSGVAVIVGTIGPFGLVSFVAARRTKETGVRKVPGATSADILVMFGREFCVLLLLAFVLAAPLATIAHRAVRASLANPVETLRYE